MGISVATTDVAAITAGTTQDITVVGFGTVKAYIIMATQGVVDGTNTAHLQVSYGFSDGTNQWVAAAGSEDSAGSTNTYRNQATNEVVMTLNTGTGAIDGEANHDSFITDGIRINWGNLPSTAVRLHVMLLGGSDLEVEVGLEGVPGPEDASHDIVLTGAFQPDALLIIGNTGGVDGNGESNGSVTIGGASSTVQGAIGCYWRDSQNNSRTNAHGYDDRIGPIAWNSQSQLNRWLEFSSFLSDGFQLILRNSDVGVNFGFLALRSATNGIFLGPILSPSASGDQGTTGIGFVPQAVAIFASTQDSGWNVNSSNGDNAGCIGSGFFDGIRESSMHVRDDNGVTTTENESRWDSTALFLRDGNSTPNTVHDASFVSFDADGFTLNYANATNARDWLVLAFEEDAEVAAHHLPFYPAKTNTLLRM